MDPRKPRAAGLKVQSGSLIFPMLLTLILGLDLVHGAALLCTEQYLEVKVTETSKNGTLTLSCIGCSPFVHSSFLYWLGNRSFIEHLPGRLQEGKTRRQHQTGGTWLQRDLVLELSPILQRTNFSCVLVDPAQITQRHVVLDQFKETAMRTSPASMFSPDTSPPTSQPEEGAQPTTWMTSDQA